jgi:hypothetical protein
MFLIEVAVRFDLLISSDLIVSVLLLSVPKLYEYVLSLSITCHCNTIHVCRESWWNVYDFLEEPIDEHGGEFLISSGERVT